MSSSLPQQTFRLGRERSRKASPDPLSEQALLRQSRATYRRNWLTPQQRVDNSDQFLRAGLVAACYDCEIKLHGSRHRICGSTTPKLERTLHALGGEGSVCDSVPE